jgi:hypothetical protein
MAQRAKFSEISFQFSEKGTWPNPARTAWQQFLEDSLQFSERSCATASTSEN